MVFSSETEKKISNKKSFLTDSIFILDDSSLFIKKCNTELFSTKNIHNFYRKSISDFFPYLDERVHIFSDKKLSKRLPNSLIILYYNIIVFTKNQYVSII